MKILKDLGVTDLKGTLKQKRRYYLVECPICSKEVTLRADSINITQTCKNCVRIINIKQKQEKAKNVLKKEKQKCTKCNKLLPLTEFHKDSTKLSGYRAVCKQCRYALEKESNAKYLKTEAGKISSANRKGKRTAAQKSTYDNSITKTALEQLKILQHNKCYYCKCGLDFNKPRSVHLDHIIPLSKGGVHTISNVVWSCQKCNLSKGNKLVSD